MTTIETDVVVVGSGPAGAGAALFLATLGAGAPIRCGRATTGSPRRACRAKVSAEIGVPLEAVVIGPGRAVTDLYYDWARLREVEEDGVLLVRPDKHIGWRSSRLPADPAAALRAALTSLLSR